MTAFSGRGAVWLARLTGGQEVAGSSPVAPIFSKNCMFSKNVELFFITQRLTLLTERFKISASGSSNVDNSLIKVGT